MQSAGLPNARAHEPREAGVSKLALGPHHYNPPEYAAMIETALESGIEEIEESEYHDLP